MLKKIVPPPAMVALARRLYVEEVPVAAIMAQTGIKSIKVLYRCLDGHHDDGSGAPQPLPALPRRCGGFNTVRSASRRGALIERIWRNAELQVEKIEARIAQSEFAPKVVERDARALAVLVRTLRELAALAQRPKPAAKAEAKPEPDDDDDIPTDIDELRRELARRIHAFVDERTGGGGAGGTPGR